MNQLAIDFQPRARAHDPITSHIAARDSHKFSNRHYERILKALREHGPMNYCQIAKVTGMEKVAVNRRLGEMLKAQMIVETGRNTPSDSGKDCREFGAA